MYLPLVLAGCAAVLIAWADGNTPREQLQQASKNERTRLSRNLDKFLRLDPAQRQELHKLHEDLKNSGAERQDLEKALIQYVRWLDTLTPSQRVRIDSAATIDERLTVVQTLIEEQNRQLEKDFRKLNEYGRPLRGDPIPAEWEERRRDSREKRIELAHALQDALESNLTPKEKETISRLGSEQEPSRSLPPYLLALAHKYSFNWEEEWAAESNVEGSPHDSARSAISSFYRSFNYIMDWYPGSSFSIAWRSNPLAYLDPVEKDHFYSAVRMATELPEVDDSELFLHFGSNGSERTREHIRNSWRSSRSSSRVPVRLAMKLLYYEANVGEVPKDYSTQFNAFLFSKPPKRDIRGSQPERKDGERSSDPKAAGSPTSAKDL